MINISFSVVINEEKKGGSEESTCVNELISFL
jgi:hypothetical protein